MAGQQVYRSTDKNGRVTLSDTPRGRANAAVNPSMAALDELLAATNYDARRAMADQQRTTLPEEGEPSIDSRLADAKAALSGGPVAQELDRIQRSSTAGAQEEARLRAEQQQGIGDALNIGWQAPTMGLSLMSGPVGLAAGAPFAYNAVKDLVDNPGVGTGVMAALSALPYAKQAKAALKGMRELSAVKALRTKFPNVGRGEVPYRAADSAERFSNFDAPLPAKAVAAQPAPVVDPPGWGSTPLGATAKSQPSQAVAAAPMPAPAMAAVEAATPEIAAIRSAITRPAGESQFGPAAQAAQMRPQPQQSLEEAVAAQLEQLPQTLKGVPTSKRLGVPDSFAAVDEAPVDWRQIPPVQGQARFVKQYVDKSQQELAQLLGERDYGFKDVGARIKRIKKPIYPEGNSKTDKLVAAMRQREKLMGYND